MLIRCSMSSLDKILPMPSGSSLSFLLSTQRNFHAAEYDRVMECIDRPNHMWDEL
jgi:hypothetical protein